ncbi:MAG: hypothetical protein LBM96_09130 [Methanobrevibacter sp.]|jgi:hypothetical protein|nr:hypothetical protein [Candidatus Methanoflexus mossambicus]
MNESEIKSFYKKLKSLNNHNNKIILKDSFEKDIENELFNYGSPLKKGEYIKVKIHL